MIHISEVTVISIDKNEVSWAIEGEILFESDLTTAFSVTYLVKEDELDELELEIVPGKYDAKLLKEMILKSAMEYEE